MQAHHASHNVLADGLNPMNRAEYGAAAHWVYKEAGPAADAQGDGVRVSFGFLGF